MNGIPFVLVFTLIIFNPEKVNATHAHLDINSNMINKSGLIIVCFDYLIILIINR